MNIGCFALVLGYFRFLPPGEWTLAVLRLSSVIFAFSLRANGHWLFCACPRLFSLSPSGRMDIGCFALVPGYFRFLPPGEWTLAVLRLSWVIFAFSLRENGHWLFCACPRLFSLSPSGRMGIGCFIPRGSAKPVNDCYKTCEFSIHQTLSDL